MAIKFNTTNGSITLDAADGTGNVDLSIPREGIQALDVNLANYTDVTANFTGILQNSGSNVVVDSDIGSTVQAFDADIAKTSVAQSFSAKQTFVGNSSSAAIEFKNAVEDGTVSATAATGTINYDILNQSVLYYTSNATGNWTLNIRGDSDTTLSSLMDIGDSMTFAFIVSQGGTAYYNNVFQIDGITLTPKWQGGTAPSAGNADSIDVYTYVVIKTGASSYTIFANVSLFA